MSAPPGPSVADTTTSRGPPRVAVIGSGPIAAEVVRNLGLVGVPAALHRAADFWRTLGLADLQDCYCAVAAGVDLAARRNLNALCQVASADMVCVSSGAQGITVEAYPFGSDPGCACLECDLRDDAPEPAQSAPDPIAASLAGALAAAAALQCAGHGARRLHTPEVSAASALLPLQRREDCPACAPPWRAPRVIRTRNRWTARDFLQPDAPALAAQIVRLSETVVTACECERCGPVAVPGTLPLACPSCGGAPLRIEARAEFTLGELAERYGQAPVPVKFALAEIGGAAVCFDLEPQAPATGDR